jgi:hypothetical protein
MACDSTKMSVEFWRSEADSTVSSLYPRADVFAEILALLSLL